MWITLLGIKFCWLLFGWQLHSARDSHDDVSTANRLAVALVLIAISSWLTSHFLSRYCSR